jgi:predicted nucleic acid-binding protein
LTNDLLDIVLLDTDVFSYLMEPGDPRGLPYLRHVEQHTPALSFITVGELLFGAFWRDWGERRTADLQRRLDAAFILPLDHETSVTYARLKTQLRKQGQALADNDLWIAALAVRHSVPLVSNNRAHFERVPGLVLISEAPNGRGGSGTASP